MIASGADHRLTPQLLAGRKHHRIICHRPQRLPCNFFGHFQRTMRLPQYTRKNADADRCLIRTPRFMPALHQVTQVPKCPGIMRVVPTTFQLFRKMPVRRVESFSRYCEHLQRHLQTVLCGKCRIRNQSRCRRRSVHQRQHILFGQRPVCRSLEKQMGQRQYFASSTLPSCWHIRHRRTDKHIRHSLCNARRYCPVALSKICEPRKHNPTHHPVWQRFPPRRRTVVCWKLGLGFSTRCIQPQLGPSAITCVYSINGYIGVLDQAHESFTGRCNCCLGNLVQFNVLMPPSHAPEVFQREIAASAKYDCHDVPMLF